MARLNLHSESGVGFDASQVEPRSSFDPLPPGWYNAQITATEEKPSSGNNGFDYNYISLRFDVMDGSYKGRVIFQNLLLDYEGPDEAKAETTRKIARETLSSICNATGVLQLDDTDQLCDIPMQVKLKIRAAQGQYDASNEIVGHKPYEGPAADGAAAGPARPGATPARPAAARPTPTPQRTAAAPSRPAARPAAAATPAKAPVTGRPGAAAPTRPATKTAATTRPAPAAAAEDNPGEAEGPWADEEAQA